MVAGYDLRINLSYFIDKPYEKEIMDKIDEISITSAVAGTTSDPTDTAPLIILSIKLLH